MFEQNYIYLIDFLKNLGNNILSPFLTIYARYKGFSESFVGIFNGILNLSPLFGFLFTLLIFYVQKRKYLNKNILMSIIFQIFLITTLLHGISWLIYYYSKTETIFLINTLLLSIIGGIFNLIYTTFILKYFRNNVEGYANLNFAYAFAYILSSLISGYVIYVSGFNYFLFLFPLIIFIILLLLFLRIEKDVKIELIDMDSETKISQKILKFIALFGFFYFSVGLAAPYFALLFTERIKLSTFEWAIVGIVEMLSYIILFPSIKLIPKKYDSRTLIFFSSFLISLTPLVWVIFKSYPIIILYSIISGVVWRVLSIAYLSYLSKLPSYFNVGLFNVITSICYSAGSFFSSLILSFYDLETIFYISAIFRFFSSILFLTLEKKSFDFKSLAKDFGIMIFNTFNILVEVFDIWIKAVILKEKYKYKYIYK